jgi:hypothetical protein
MFFVRFRKRTAWSIPCYLLRGGRSITAKRTAKSFRLQADKDLTTTNRQVLERNPVIKAIKGADTTLTFVTGGVLNGAFNSDNCGFAKLG